MRSPLPLVVALAMVLAACGEQVAVEPAPGGSGQASPGATAVHPDAVWFEVLGVTEAAGGDLGVDLAQSRGELAAFWDAHGFDEPVPEPGFDEHVVALVRRGDNACPDEVMEVRRVGAALEHTLLPPPGACNDPYIVWAYAIAYHRGDLGEEVTLRIDEADGPDGTLTATFTLPPYDGPPAPPPSPPPRQLTDEALAAVFAGHPVRPCTELHDPREEVLSGQPAPDDGGSPGGAPAGVDVPGDVQTAYAAEYPGEFGWFMVDQAAGEWVVGVTGDVEGHRARLSARHPGQRFRVVETPHAQRDLAAAQEAARPLHTGDDPLLVHSSHFAYLELGVIDPTRDDLDKIAAVVDPTLACVEPVLSGLPR